MLSLGTTFLKYLQSLLRYYFDASVESFFLPLYLNRKRNDLRLDPVGDGVVGTESERRVTVLFRDRKRVKDAEADFIRVQESGKFVAESVLDQNGIPKMLGI